MFDISIISSYSVLFFKIPYLTCRESTSQNPAFSDRPMNRPVSVALAVDAERDVEPRKSDPGLSTANDNPNQAGIDDKSILGPKVMKDNFLTGGQVDDG